MNDHIAFEDAMTADEFIRHCMQVFGYINEACYIAAAHAHSPLRYDGDIIIMQRMMDVRYSMMERYNQLTGSCITIDAYAVGWELGDAPEAHSDSCFIG